MKLKFEWERITVGGFGWTERAKVIGGWLVRTVAIGDINTQEQRLDSSPTIQMIFIVDANHEWEIEVGATTQEAQ